MPAASDVAKGAHVSFATQAPAEPQGQRLDGVEALEGGRAEQDVAGDAGAEADQGGVGGLGADTADEEVHDHDARGDRHFARSEAPAAPALNGRGAWERGAPGEHLHLGCLTLKVRGGADAG